MIIVGDNPIPPLSRELFVDPNTLVDPLDQDGSVEQPFSTIQAALTASSAAPVLIVIQFGDYSAAALTIGANRDVVIEGPERRQDGVVSIGNITWTVSGSNTSRLTLRRLQVDTVTIADGVPPATSAWFRAEDCMLGGVAGNAITVTGSSVVTALVAGQSYATTDIVPPQITSQVVRPIDLNTNGFLFLSQTQLPGANAIDCDNLFAESCTFDEATAFTIGAGLAQFADCLFPGGGSTLTFVGVAGEARFDVTSLFNWRFTGNTIVNGQYIAEGVAAAGFIAEPVAGVGVPRFNSSSIYLALVLGSYADGQFDGAANGALYAGARRSAVAGTPPTAAPFALLNPYDAGAPFTGIDTGRTLYYGGGGWTAPDTHNHQFYSAPPPYSETLDTGVIVFALSHGGGVIGQVAQHRGAVTYQSSSTVSLGASVSNFSPAGLAGANTLRITPTVGAPLVAITGLAGGVDGRILIIQNMSAAFTLTLTNEDVLSLAINRFTCPGAAALVIPVSGNTILRYDGTATRWRPLIVS